MYKGATTTRIPSIAGLHNCHHLKPRQKISEDTKTIRNLEKKCPCKSSLITTVKDSIDVRDLPMSTSIQARCSLFHSPCPLAIILEN